MENESTFRVLKPAGRFAVGTERCVISTFQVAESMGSEAIPLNGSTYCGFTSKSAASPDFAIRD